MNGKRAKQLRAEEKAGMPSPKRRLSRLASTLLAVTVVMALTVGGYLAFAKPTPSTSAVADPVSRLPQAAKAADEPRTLDELLSMPTEQLADVDVARMNLLCATGLPGAENLEIGKCLATLDQWAARVKLETDRHFYRFHQNPGDYQNSEGYFRMLMLITVVQQDFGIHYNMQRIRNIDFRRSQDLFIHGMIGSDNGGTCVSMPVIYAAVARRLGYPLKLVLTKAHVFCRWEAPNDRVNVEATNKGMNSYDDAYYKTWPEAISEAEVQANRYLLSLSPAEELASFLASRGHCLLDNGRTKEAFDAYAAANRLDSPNPTYLAWARDAHRRLQPSPVVAGGPRNFRGPPLAYRHDPMADIERANAINRANMQRMQPPAPGVQPAYQPFAPGQPRRP